MSIISRVVNVGFEPQRTINYKSIVDEAIEKCEINRDSIKCIIYNRPEEKTATLIPNRDRDWNDLLSSARKSGDCVPVQGDHPLYLLYTSGKNKIHSTSSSTLFSDVQFRHHWNTESYCSSNSWLCCHASINDELHIQYSSW